MVLHQFPFPTFATTSATATTPGSTSSRTVLSKKWLEKPADRQDPPLSPPPPEPAVLLLVRYCADNDGYCYCSFHCYYHHSCCYCPLLCFCYCHADHYVNHHNCCHCYILSERPAAVADHSSRCDWCGAGCWAEVARVQAQVLHPCAKQIYFRRDPKVDPFRIESGPSWRNCFWSLHFVRCAEALQAAMCAVVVVVVLTVVVVVMVVVVAVVVVLVVMVVVGVVVVVVLVFVQAAVVVVAIGRSRSCGIWSQ